MIAASEFVAQKYEKSDKLDVLLHPILRINQFIRDSLSYHQANNDLDNALSQLDFYSFLNDWSRQLIINNKKGSSILGAWSLLEELLEVVDRGSPTDLCLINRIQSKYKEWCKFKSTQEQSGTSDSKSTEVSVKPRRKRSHSVHDSLLIKRKSLAAFKDENSVHNNNKLLPATDSAESSLTCSESKIGVSSNFKVVITEKDNMRVMKLLHGAMCQVVVTKFNLQLYRSDIRTLFGSNWLNDNVINFYMELLNERSQQNVGQLPSVYAMNSYFIPRLMGTGYWSVRRWTRKVDLFSKEIIPVPVHYNGNPSHWSMAIIHMRDKTIRFYDSLGQGNPAVLAALEAYLQKESLDKRHRPFDTSDFKVEKVKNVPRQYNGNDCGVFCCMFAEFVTRNAPLTFTQDHMAALRKRMILEIADGKLWT